VDFGAQNKDHVYITRPQEISFSKIIGEFFLWTTWVGWKQPLSDHHEEEDTRRIDTIHILSQDTIYSCGGI